MVGKKHEKEGKGKGIGTVKRINRDGMKGKTE